MGALMVGVDVGYGFVKAVVATDRRVSFPSVVAADGGSGDLSAALGAGPAVGHRLAVQGVDGSEERYLVGDAGVAAGARRTWDTQAARRPDYGVLVLTALALLGVDGDVDVSLGLPLALYLQAGERQALRARLDGLQGWVSVDGGAAAYVEVCGAQVFPQSAGAFFRCMSSETGLAKQPCGVIDVGFRTTDHLLLLGNRRSRGLVPSETHSGTIDRGAGLIYQAVRQAVERSSGRMLPDGAVEDALEVYGGRLTVAGSEYDVKARMTGETRVVAEAIATEVRRAWGEHFDLLGALIVTGGGGRICWPVLHSLHPRTRLDEEPVFGNALGFLLLDQARRRNTAAMRS